MRELKVGEKVFVELEVKSIDSSCVVFKDSEYCREGEEIDKIHILHSDINILEKPEFEFGEEIEVQTYYGGEWKPKIFICMNKDRYITVRDDEVDNYNKGYDFKVSIWSKARKPKKVLPKLSRTSLLAIAKEKLGYDVEIEE